MLELLPLLISAIALVLAPLSLRGLETLRVGAVVMALGCGQIYVATAALVLFLLAESRWRFDPKVPGIGYIWLIVMLLGIAVTTAVVPLSNRLLSEAAQLILYILIFFLTANYMRSGVQVMNMLTGCIIGASAVALIALMLFVTGIQSQPGIFLGRGSNEAAEFIAILGAAPAAILFVRNRNPIYIAPIALIAYVQFLATSRGSLLVTAIVTLAAVFFVTRSLLARAVLLAAGLYILLSNLLIITSVYQANLNFSARERLALLRHGQWLWEQRWITGWGWGSTTELAQTAGTTELVYPHFHNTYIQLMVESGLVGIAIIASFFVFTLKSVGIAALRIRDPAVTMAMVALAISITILGFFDAMLYGADRAVQVILGLALMVRILQLGAKTYLGRVPLRAGPAPLKRAHPA